ncbi:kinase-like domain-containing protein [Fennellomyces sp. T-0311]|nr:kinase-like domain-containing protein [Fennellomyces sp. T-0311]
MQGMFSTVEKHQLETRLVAVKKYKKYHGQLVQRHYQRELWALRTMGLETETMAREKHVIYLMSAESTNGAHYLTFPFYENTLHDYVEKKDRQFALRAVYQMAQALEFIHSQGIIHCDLSPLNILVDEEEQMALADFGCAHLYSSDAIYPDSGCNAMDEVGTRYYKAPEHLFGYRVYKPSTDIWSLGTIFCELLLGHPIFEGQNDLEQIGAIVRSLGAPSDRVKDEEMEQYPDANKLIFFSDTEYDEDEWGDDETYCEENKGILVSKMPNAKHFSLGSTLRDSLVAPEDQALIRQMLTWSTKERITAKEVHLTEAR